MTRIWFQRTIICLVCLLWLVPAKADQGMWLPLLLKELNEDRMQELGMRMSAEDIYSVNAGSLKDAIVSFGGYCTGEVISERGLLLTNHHCGYGVIQSHSSVENDLLTKGFWAMSPDEELPNPNLFVRFLIRMEDVTAQVMEGATEDMPEVRKAKLIEDNIAAITAAAIEGTHYEAEIKPFFFGSEYYMFITEKFEDVRLVGAPPSFVGKFGGDTDNWEFPRHTGDFSLFRIYAGPDGKPAPYSEDNIPMKPRRSLKISLAGTDPGDFTMVFGFPGRTSQFMTSEAVRLLLEETNPHRIEIRDTKLKIMDRYMKESDAVRIQYASTYASIANYWKKWIGESMGLERYDAVAVKEQQEADFADWVAADADRVAQYGSVLEDISAEVAKLQEGNLAYHYLREGFLRSDAIGYLGFLSQLANASDRATFNEMKEEAKEILASLHIPLEKEVMEAMVSMYIENVPNEYQPSSFQTAGSPTETFFRGDWLSEAWLEENGRNARKLGAAFQELAALSMVMELQTIYGKAVENAAVPQERIDELSKSYVAGLREMQPEKAFAPDANSTLRVAYGQVGGMEPRDGLVYRHYTTLDGVIEKEVPDVAETHEFYLDSRIKELAAARDYGQWADEDGYLPVNFLASNHSTGGNSGSPIIDADGNLIGLNFDRTWQSTMSDVMYNGEICRNIAVDVRYICWMIDKYAGATHLIEEMSFVNVSETVVEE